MQRDVERIEEIYEAIRRKKTAAVLALAAPEIEISQSSELPWGGIYSGQEGLKLFQTKLAEHLDSRVEIECCIDAGDHIVATGRTVGKARATGLEFDIPLVQVWKLCEGRIVRLETYLDNATMLAALGL